MSRTPALTPQQFSTFGELLKFLRRRAGLSQRELSIAVGYSESQISRLEQNQRAPDEAAVAARFVSALDLETERAWVARLLELAPASRVAGESEQPEHEAHTPSHNLPLQLSSFVGREREITELERLLSTSRLVTLTGAGGVGKTRLALQVAAELLDSFPDGVWLVELAPLADPALVPQTVAAVLGLSEMPGRPLISALLDHLRPKRLLLILDNCEHLIQACAELTETLLRVCPQLSILATSREGLGIAGERAYPVPTLSLPEPNQPETTETVASSEAVRLFVERAVAVLPDFTLSNDNAPAVVQVCRRLDGIPLAIELAAAPLKVLQVEQLAVRLNDRFRLLTGGSRTALPRHQTLEALIDWSYALLTGAEQVLLQRLSVFAGGWTLDAAEVVCAGEDDEDRAVLKQLTQLVNKSLVVTEREPGRQARYSLLETIRQYALAKLAASGEADVVRRRHAACYLAIAESGRLSRRIVVQPVWLDRVETEHDNMRAALTWSQSATGSAELGLRLAGALGPFWAWRNYWHEGRGWQEDALAHADAEGVNNPPARAELIFALGTIVAAAGDYTAGVAMLATGLQLFQELGDTFMSAWSLERLGWQARERGDAASARRLLEESLVLFRQLGQENGIAWASTTLAEVAVIIEDVAWATALLQESLTLFHRLGDSLGIGWSLNHLGHLAQVQGEYERAMRLHEESLPLFRELSLKNLGVAWAFQSLGESALAQGDAVLAMAHSRGALEVFRALGDRAGIGWCLAGLAGTATLSEEPERAAWLWGAAEALRQSIGARPAPAARATRERLMAEARAQLGEAAFDAAWAAGQAVSAEQAITEALRPYA